MTNIMGNFFKVISFGESHGRVVGCIIDGCPCGVFLNKLYIQLYLERRRPGTSKLVTPRNELDQLLVLSGIFNNVTTGTPIGIIVRNKDYHNYDYNNLGLIYRPGHADYTYDVKYGIRDYNGGGRSSARVTIALVIAGSLARYIIFDFFGISIYAFLLAVGRIIIPISFNNNFKVLKYFIPNKLMVSIVEKYLKLVIFQHNSLGAIIGCVISNLICGIGEPLFRKLNSELTKNIMSLNAVKAIEFGLGMNCFRYKGSDHNDLIYDKGFLSNNSGGILGGISTGQDVSLKVYIKPTASVSVPQLTITNLINNKLIIIKGRHDPCVGIRAVPIIESIVAITLLDLLLQYRLIKFF